MQTTHQRVMFFIGLIKGHKNGHGHDAHDVLEKIYSRGNCYMFAKALQFAFPEAEVLSTPWLGGHAVAKIDGRYYDITGELKDDNRWCKLERFRPFTEEEIKCAQTWCYSHKNESCIGLLDENGRNVGQLDSLEFDEGRNAWALPGNTYREDVAV